MMSSSDNTPVAREELHSLVWSMPVGAAAKRFGVSGSYLARICKALAVPTPPRGWWAKVRAGQHLTPPELPPAMPGFPREWTKSGIIGQPMWTFYNMFSETVREPVPYKHPLVRIASTAYAKAKLSGDGHHLAPRGSRSIDLLCTAATVNEALELADMLFARLALHGHRVWVTPGHGLHRPVIQNCITPLRYTKNATGTVWKPKRPTITVIGGVAVGLAILEISKEVEMRYVGDGIFVKAASCRSVPGITWTEWQRLPIGRFKVVAYDPSARCAWQRDWIVTRRRSAARLVREVVEALVEIAATLPQTRSCLPDN
ncbi:hypothetical protein [Rhizobium oryzicola]|uniref:Uncharacterized protein n=1 Tax=Rhizobium oryzicola TaxID=1232668 RepID=A0ABT8T4P1_9HYPH|nr:hypothetical protein [Rhizobium oryzicola]MDO1585258.1 hypothetical protein [Rhizobium oryzicola]